MLENNFQNIVVSVFLAQLWKHNGQILENKNGDWKYLKETWILPQSLTSEKKIKEEEKSDGFLIPDSLGSVLTANMDDTGTYSIVPHKHLASFILFYEVFY